jgi:Na+/H+-dicarboxylate symporter
MASLPLTLRIADEIGIPKRTASFVIPLGTTADMNGICCYLSLATVFAAQLFGIELTVASYFFVMLQSVILAIGAAAVPASGVVMLLTLFTALGFPLEVVAIIAGGYKIVDGIHTTTNAVGDLVLAMAVSGSELDLTKYNASKNSVDELAG